MNRRDATDYYAEEPVYYLENPDEPTDVELFSESDTYPRYRIQVVTTPSNKHLEKFFGVKPGKGLDLNGIIRSFEKLSPAPVPRHWLNIADAVRNIGNVPGAHPRPIPS